MTPDLSANASGQLPAERRLEETLGEVDELLSQLRQLTDARR